MIFNISDFFWVNLIHNLANRKSYCILQALPDMHNCDFFWILGSMRRCTVDIFDLQHPCHQTTKYHVTVVCGRMRTLQKSSGLIIQEQLDPLFPKSKLYRCIFTEPLVQFYFPVHTQRQTQYNGEEFCFATWTLSVVYQWMQRIEEGSEILW